jgi:hypothetical protein
MPRMITEGASAAPKESATVADQRAIGCGQEYISFTFPDGGNYLCDKEKKFAEVVLNRNQELWPAVAIFPTGLATELLYAQCSFKYTASHNHKYKEAAGIKKFLSKGCVVEFLREYNVNSLIVGPRALADVFYALDEPRIEESLFIIDSEAGAVTRYRSRPQKESKSASSSTNKPVLSPSNGTPFHLKPLIIIAAIGVLALIVWLSVTR